MREKTYLFALEKHCRLSTWGQLLTRFGNSETEGGVTLGWGGGRSQKKMRTKCVYIVFGANQRPFMVETPAVKTFTFFKACNFTSDL